MNIYKVFGIISFILAGMGLTCGILNIIGGNYFYAAIDLLVAVLNILWGYQDINKGFSK